MAPEDARREAQEPLDGDLEQTLPGVWGKILTLKMSFSPKEYMGTREALGREGNKIEEGWSGQGL